MQRSIQKMPEYKFLGDIPQFPKANYQVNVAWSYIDQFLANNKFIDENPDYQRGYVWTECQQRQYVEYILRGGTSGRDVYWNCPNWQYQKRNTKWHNTLELVDGKQRLQAVRKFMGNHLKVFGKYLNQYADATTRVRMRIDFVFHVNTLATKKEVVDWYLGMNTGGSIHTEADLKTAYDVLESLTIKQEK